MKAQPIIALDGSTVARIVDRTVTEAFGRPLATPFRLLVAEWRRPSTRGAGLIVTRSYSPAAVSP